MRIIVYWVFFCNLKLLVPSRLKLGILRAREAVRLLNAFHCLWTVGNFPRALGPALLLLGSRGFLNEKAELTVTVSGGGGLSLLDALLCQRLVFMRGFMRWLLADNDTL